VSLFGVAWTHLMQGNLRAATSTAERGLMLCENMSLGVLAPWFLAILGYAAALQRRLPAARLLLEDAIGRGATSNRFGAAFFPAWLSEVASLAGYQDEAMMLGRRSLSLVKNQAARGFEVRALRAIAIAAADSGAAELAESHYREALLLAQELGTQPLAAHCHLGLGKLYRRTGKHEQAREHLAIATTMFREMDMRFWLEQAEAELAAVR
jgi:tetratricopeptide (TPR) repeat protein